MGGETLTITAWLFDSLRSRVAYETMKQRMILGRRPTAPPCFRYDCEGCSLTIYAPGLTESPKHGLCGSCAWLCEYLPDPVEMMEAREMLNLPHLTRERR